MGIETKIEVTLTNRNRLTALFRLILVLPIVAWISIFISNAISTINTKKVISTGNQSFDSAFNDSFHTSSKLSVLVAIFVTAGYLVMPIVFSLLFTGKYPSYLLTFNHGMMELHTRVFAYVFLLTDRYPSVERNDSVAVIFPDIDGGKNLSRGMPLVKWLLAIPLVVVGFLYSIGGLIAAIIAWFTIIITGKMPESLASFNVDLIAYWNRVFGYYLILVTDEYPAFRLGE